MGKLGGELGHGGDIGPDYSPDRYVESEPSLLGIAVVLAIPALWAGGFLLVGIAILTKGEICGLLLLVVGLFFAGLCVKLYSKIR